MPHVSGHIHPEWDTIRQAEFRDSLTQLNDSHDLATFWGVAPRQLNYYAFHVDKGRAYSTFSIPKRNGGQRAIKAPCRTLKYIQRLIHESLSRAYGPHPAVHGFRQGRSIVSNAKEHTGRQYVLHVDLEDFFPSITRKRIYGRLIALPYELKPKVANLIASLATDAYSRMPQGSPSSPVIANILAAELDTDLAKLCGSFHCTYTRYADDITISTLRNSISPELARYPHATGTGQVIIGDKLRTTIEKHGFQINHRKSRLHSYWTRQICTGLVVNNRNVVTPPRSYIRRLRALVDNWAKHGWQHAALKLHDDEHRPLFGDREHLIKHVRGRIAYLRMVRGHDDSISERLDEKVTAIPPDY